MPDPAGAPAGRPLRAQVIFFFLFLSVILLSHLRTFTLPLYWDELGYFVPAALDLFREGRWIPFSTAPGPHPPGLSLYLAAVWTFAGYSIPATRLAMLLPAAALAFAAFLLAIRLCRDAAGYPALAAAGFLLVCPLFYTQAVMAQLDLPAALFTILALYFFLDHRLAAAVVCCCLLVLTKETGVAVPLVLAFWLLRERRFRQAAWFAFPLLLLAGWLCVVRSATGHWFGAEKFSAYNLEYPLHPFRLTVGLVRRIYALTAADFQWVGLLALLAGLRRGLFRGRSWAVAATLSAAHLVLVTLLGGAYLERYLLPVWPVFFAAAARAFGALAGWRAGLAPLAMGAGLLAGLFVNPPYPFPYENNLSMHAFVRLHQAAAQLLEQDYPHARITTAWPLSDALRRPDFGYVRRPLKTRELPDFSPHALARMTSKDIEVLVLYSREWQPRRSWMHIGWVRRLWERFFSYQPPVAVEECRSRFNLRSVIRLESKGQWIEVLVSDRIPEPPRVLRF